MNWVNDFAVIIENDNQMKTLRHIAKDANLRIVGVKTETEFPIYYYTVSSHSECFLIPAYENEIRGKGIFPVSIKRMQKIVKEID